jgi:uncharacterized protein (TIGR01777 family)
MKDLTPRMRVAVTGASGLIGRRLVSLLRDRGDEAVAFSRSPGLGAVVWDPLGGPAPAAALSGCDAVVHLAGENIAQRWTPAVKERIRASRELGTRNLVAGLRAAEPRPAALVHASGGDYYAQRGDERVDESGPPGDGYLAQVCVAWEREASAAKPLGLRVTHVRTGPVLHRSGGALQRMLVPFRLGLGGPVAGGRQWFSWIALDDIAGIYLAALHGGEAWAGPVNACAPEPVRNADFARALGRALHRPAVLPVPGLALKALYGDMAQIVTGGVRMVPARATELGYRFRHPELDEALGSALG